MPPQRPPQYVQRDVSRHGQVRWYFRRRPGPRIRLPDEYGSNEFWAAYNAALSGEATAPPRRRKPNSESLSWLFDRYRESAAWRALKPSTRYQRDNVMKRIVERAGDHPYKDIRRGDIARGRDERADVPSTAKDFLQVMRAVFDFAVEMEYVEVNPALTVKFKRPKSDGHHTWTSEEVENFENRWPIGTRERLALAIFLYTGLRLGDAARLGQHHIQDAFIEIITEKTGDLVALPVLPELARIIEQSPIGEKTLIATKTGRPMTKESLGNRFREACKAAGVPGTAHGLRKAGAARAAEQGATVHQLNAIFGWTDTRMAGHYTKKADRRRIASEAIEKLSREKKQAAE